MVREGYIVLFGEKPTYPETGYGYIKYGEEIKEGIFRVEDFKEKPSQEKAEEYLREGNFFWNCGIFLFSIERIIRDYENLLP